MGRPIWHDAGILIAGVSKIERSHPMAEEEGAPLGEFRASLGDKELT